MIGGRALLESARDQPLVRASTPDPHEARAVKAFGTNDKGRMICDHYHLRCEHEG